MLIVHAAAARVALYQPKTRIGGCFRGEDFDFAWLAGEGEELDALEEGEGFGRVVVVRDGYVSWVVVGKGFVGLVRPHEGVDGLAHVAHGAGTAIDVSCFEGKEGRESWRTI